MRNDLGKVSGASDFKALVAKLRTEQNVPGPQWVASRHGQRDMAA